MKVLLISRIKYVVVYIKECPGSVGALSIHTNNA